MEMPSGLAGLTLISAENAERRLGAVALVRSRRATSLRRRRTMPVQAAVIGSRSGLMAIAPTMRIELSSMTPKAAITPAAAMNTR
jgi:hypothetical protein